MISIDIDNYTLNCSAILFVNYISFSIPNGPTWFIKNILRTLVILKIFNTVRGIYMYYNI